MKYYACLCIILFCTKWSYEQTTIAKYKCIYQTSWQKAILDSISGNSNFEIPASVEIIYTITTDGKYLVAKASVNKASTIQGINFNFSDSEAIFDLTKSLVYFPETKKLKKIKMYDLEQGSSANNSSYRVHGYDSTYVVELRKDLKKYVSPAVFFNNSTSGILRITTPNLSIVLIDPLQHSNKVLLCKEYFKNVDSNDIKEEYSFF